MIYRHGDLTLKSVKLDKSIVKLIGKFKKFVLAEGETTGHKHLLESKTAFNVYQNDKGQYILEMEGKSELTHEEHNKIELMPDLYILGNEQEYNYFEEQSQRVQD